MKIAANGISLHVREDGDPSGPPVIFANSLGTDLTLWDPIIPHMPESLSLIRYDKRGHGRSDCPAAPYSMGALISDLEALLDHLRIRNAVIVGCSIGGMIAQGLAVKRLDQVRGLVLSNTACKIGTKQMWQERIDAVEAGGIEALADATMERWFSHRFQTTSHVRAWRDLMTGQPKQGYIGCMAAISGTDFFASTSGLTLPTLAIAGNEDGSTPPDLVRETADLIRGSRFELIRGAGHLPMIEKPEEYAMLLSGFLKEIGHL